MTVGKYEYSEEPHIITRTEIGDVEFNNTVLKIASQAARKDHSRAAEPSDILCVLYSPRDYPKQCLIV